MSKLISTFQVTLTTFRDISAEKTIWMYQSKMRNGITVEQMSPVCLLACPLSV